MGKTHEALKSAERAYQKHLLKYSKGRFAKGMITLSKRAARVRSDRWLADLKSNLFNGYFKSILFVGTSDRGNSYNFALDFAMEITKNQRLRVLLIDLSLWTLEIHEVLKIDGALGLFDLFDNSGEMTSKIMKVGPGNLYTLRWGANQLSTVKLFDSSRFSEFLKMMARRFDYIILNSPHVSSFSECRSLCARVDALVLVLRNGKTGRQVALRAKEQLSRKPGHKLLGVVLDGRKGIQSQFALIAGAVVAMCIVFFLGLFIGKTQVMVAKDASPFDQRVMTEIKNQPESQVSLPSRNQPKPSAQAMMSSKVSPPKAQQVADGADQIEKNAEKDSHQKSAASPADAKDAPGEKKLEKEKMVRHAPSRAVKSRIVVVEKGDSLTSIISRVYGEYNNTMLSDVLRENPGIQSIDRIYVGQVIKLPHYEDTPKQGHQHDVL